MGYKGWENFVPPVSRGTAAKPAPAKRSKFGNVPVEVDGIRFDSKREAARYQVLKLRMAAGEIRELRLQPEYLLHADGNDEPVAKYVPDFDYRELVSGVWMLVVEDVKGCRTDVYKLKKKWFEAQMGMQIRET